MNLDSSQTKRLRSRNASNRVLLSALLGLILSAMPGTVSAQTSSADPFRNQSFETPTTAADDEFSDAKLLDFFPELYNKNQKIPVFQMESIAPQQGPTTGETRVLVRAGPLTKWENQFLRPQCKFGDQVVSGQYVKCHKSALSIKEKEFHSTANTQGYRCIMCENSPKVDFPQTTMFSISLTGDFSDSTQQLEFEYYSPTVIEKIYPRYGPKDGDTPVKVWGRNFKEFGGEGAMCGFGTRDTKATVFNDTYIECRSPQSDVIEKPIPFTISLNNQQNSPDTLFFWYYTYPNIHLLDPDRGPEDGGTEITLKGTNFYPFKAYLDQIDNALDTWCAFPELNARGRATVISSTMAKCFSPQAKGHKFTRVEISLNGVEYTEDENKFYYYKPPNLFDLEPRMGPVRGGTKVVVTGSNFENTNEIECDFGVGVVPGTFVSSSEVECTSPPASKAGYVQLRLSLRKGLWSSPFKYLYYDTPQISGATPTCGPESGYTQIEVTGKNFVDLGRNTAMCVFNNTIYTNATVFSDTQLFCDSPVFEDDQGIPLLNKKGPDGNFYNVKVTIDGGREVSPQSFKFTYYRQTEVTKISPNKGPIAGGSTIAIGASGLDKGVGCGIVVRLGPDEYIPKQNENGQLEITTHKVNYPGPVSLQVSFNGQQFSKQTVAHSKDPKSTFWYHVHPVISHHHPNSGPWTGQTPLVIEGIGFKPFEEEELAGIAGIENNLYIRYADTLYPHAPLIADQKVDHYTNEQLFLLTPSQPPGQKALIQISFNKQDWLTVKSPKIDYSFTWYDTPHVTQVSPPFGPVKNPNPLMVTVSGTNFVCPDPTCKFVKCRFGEPPHMAVYVEGTMTSDGKIQCLAPVYVQPDILRLEVTLNDVDYSHDNKTFGYFDPFVVDAKPRLINVDGSTKVTITGIGFVDSGETKSMFSNPLNPVSSPDGVVKSATFIDKNNLKTSTLPQDKLVYTSTGKSVMWDPFYCEVSVYNDEFTDNRIPLYYYEQPVFFLPANTETPANLPDDIFITVKYNANDQSNFSKFGDFLCRFSSGDKVKYTKAAFVYTPFAAGSNKYDANTPNTVHCKTPFWDMDASLESENVKLDVTVNGQHYSGGLEYTFSQKLVLHRDVPMAGPLSGNTKTELIGQSFRALKSQKVYSAKWGPIASSEMHEYQSAGNGQTDTSVKEIFSYSYTFEGYQNTIPGSEEIYAYWHEATSIPKVDTEMDPTYKYQAVYKYSPQILAARPMGSNATYNTTYGGPWYIEVGQEKLYPLDGTQVNSTAPTSYIYHDYIPSSVEFYEYKKESLLQIRPTKGLSKGGTKVEVVGFDFRYLPEYGVVPHCKFDNTIVRAKFDSNVRLVCYAPPNDNIGVTVPFEVSLNGVDWTSSGLKFSYYEEPILKDVFPDGGDSRGGSDVYFLGDKFSNFTTTAEEFNCRFTPTTIKAEPKIMAATFVNTTAIKCKSPGGWSKGDKMSLQITFNGVDYDQNGFSFIFYHIQDAFPRSGPSNGLGGDIVISGEGFRADKSPKCRLNKVVTDPVSVSWNEIRCPMTAHPNGPTFFGDVDFAVTANGLDWFEFEDGFQYYEQPIVTDIYPKQGPASGIGIINFYGTGFRSDFGLAKLGCKIGKSQGQAFFVSKNQMTCVVEDMETVPEGDRLPARVALNSYSWTDTVDEETGSTFFVPYSIFVIYPQDGPATGGSDVLIQGSGFVENEHMPRCKFGTKNNYVIVEAEILSYNRMTCTTPEGFTQKEPVEYPADVPFAVALMTDSFEPWTDTGHKFRFFKQPVISKVTPAEVEVGQMTTVTVLIDHTVTDRSNIFFEPIPAAMQQFNHDTGDDIGPTLAQFSYIICGWGRFGQTRAVYLNQTAILCTTPSVPDDPMDISREPITFQVSMNGFDFEDAPADVSFTFVGKGSGMGMLMYLILFVLIAALIGALIVFENQLRLAIGYPQS